jgi:uncharacterized protein (DUF1697 family)
MRSRARGEQRGMTVFVALLRAINVGGTGKLPMKDLMELCVGAGFDEPKTYIQSGNVLLRSNLSEASTQAKLQRALHAHMGKAVGVTLRTADELAATLAHNPFKKQPPTRVLISFVNDPLQNDVLKDVVAPDGEELALHGRELFVHYPTGLVRSKLKLPQAKEGTTRNVNTVTKLLELALAHEGRAP